MSEGLPPTSNYEVVKEITSFRDIANHFKEDGDSYLLLGTGGWHGSNWTLADCERILNDEDEIWTTQGAYITVFIIQPALVSLKWGNVKLKNMAEVEWLRKKVKDSVDRLRESQEVHYV